MAAEGELGRPRLSSCLFPYFRGWHEVVYFSAFPLAQSLPILMAGPVPFVRHRRALISAGPLGHNSVTTGNTDMPLACREMEMVLHPSSSSSCCRNVCRQ